LSVTKTEGKTGTREDAADARTPKQKINAAEDLETMG